MFFAHACSGHSAHGFGPYLGVITYLSHLSINNNYSIHALYTAISNSSGPIQMLHFPLSSIENRISDNSIVLSL